MYRFLSQIFFNESVGSVHKISELLLPHLPIYYGIKHVSFCEGKKKYIFESGP